MEIKSATPKDVLLLQKVAGRLAAHGCTREEGLIVHRRTPYIALWTPDGSSVGHTTSDDGFWFEDVELKTTKSRRVDVTKHTWHAGALHPSEESKYHPLELRKPQAQQLFCDILALAIKAVGYQA